MSGPVTLWKINGWSRVVRESEGWEETPKTYRRKGQYGSLEIVRKDRVDWSSSWSIGEYYTTADLAKAVLIRAGRREVEQTRANLAKYEATLAAMEAAWPEVAATV